MDFIAGCFHDGFVLYAKALSEALADGVSQNDGINITVRMQNRRIWGVLSVFDLWMQRYMSDKSIQNMTLWWFDVHFNKMIVDYNI